MRNEDASISILIRRPIVLVTVMWLAATLFPAWAAIGPVHRDDIPTYWSFESFFTVLSGPLAVLFASPNPRLSDCVLAVLMAVVLVWVTARYVRRPSTFAGFALGGGMFFWILFGVGVTYAWV